MERTLGQRALNRATLARQLLLLHTSQAREYRHGRSEFHVRSRPLISDGAATHRLISRLMLVR